MQCTLHSSKHLVENAGNYVGCQIMMGFLLRSIEFRVHQNYICSRKLPNHNIDSVTQNLALDQAKVERTFLNSTLHGKNSPKPFKGWVPKQDRNVVSLQKKNTLNCPHDDEQPPWDACQRRCINSGGLQVCCQATRHRVVANIVTNNTFRKKYTGVVGRSCLSPQHDYVTRGPKLSQDGWPMTSVQRHELYVCWGSCPAAPNLRHPAFCWDHILYNISTAQGGGGSFQP